MPARAVPLAASSRHWLTTKHIQDIVWPLPDQVGDLVVVDGGMVSMEVKQKFGPDVKVVVVDPGIVLSRANLTFRRHGRLVRARNSMLPVLSSKVWLLGLALLWPSSSEDPCPFVKLPVACRYANASWTIY